MVSIAIKVLDILFNILAGIFLLRLIAEEISPSQLSPLARLLHTITEPVLAPIRKILPNGIKDRLYIDISPLIVVFFIIVLKILSIKILLTLSSRFRAPMAPGPIKPLKN